jgi:uncharacterized protein YrrD
MLRSVNSILGSTILARDGELGHVHDFLFDDRTWTVRYLVVETGSWLASRRVLLSPSIAGWPDWEKRVLPINLTKDQVRASPDLDTAKPVSRQEEIAMSQHYGWPAYWTMEPPLMPIPMTPLDVSSPPAPEGDPHLRSTREISNYEVQSSDAEVGRIDDLILDDSKWFIAYLAVGTGSWFSGQRVMLSTRSVASISWSHRQIHFDHLREEM